VTSFAQLLVKNEAEHLNPGMLENLQIIVEEAKKMDRLISALLRFSRTERSEMLVRPVDVNTLVHEARQNLRIEENDRQICWEIASLPAIQGDPALLQQVWHNLLSNAVKYTATCQKPRIEIGVADEMAEKEGQVALFIRDNGVGFNQRYAYKLFGVFRRLHSEKDFKGTGIGLAIVKRIISRHGGRVWAEGEVDRGATFYLTLPLADDVHVNS